MFSGVPVGEKYNAATHQMIGASSIEVTPSSNRSEARSTAPVLDISDVWTL